MRDIQKIIEKNPLLRGWSNRKLWHLIVMGFCVLILFWLIGSLTVFWGLLILIIFGIPMTIRIISGNKNRYTDGYKNRWRK